MLFTGLGRFWQLVPVTQGTWQWSPKSRFPTVGVEDPLSPLERGTVPDMLAVTALQLRHPVP